MGSRKKLFILQFTIDGHGTVEDLDRLIEIEETLDGALRRNGSGYVDGHDIGSGKMSIFVFCPSWACGEGFLSLYLRYQDWASEVIVVERRKDKACKVIWPRDFDGTFELV